MSEWDLFGVFDGVGAIFVIAACRRGWRAFRTRAWRATEGVMTSASWRLIGTGEDSEAHELLVRYRYMVDGVSYTASRFSLAGRNYGRREDADAAVARLAPGTRVTVFHGRLRPSEAVLERETVGLGTILVALAGLAIFVLGGVLFPAKPG